MRTWVSNKLGPLRLPSEPIVVETMAPVFTIGIDVVVIGFSSDPRERPMDVSTEPLRISVDTTSCVLGNEVNLNASRIMLTKIVDVQGWGLFIVISANSE